MRWRRIPSVVLLVAFAVLVVLAPVVVLVLIALTGRLSWQRLGELATLNEVSAPQLNYPYDVNRQTGAMLQFGGATGDGISSSVYPPLLQDATRY
jgi:hypothetical protein